MTVVNISQEFISSLAYQFITGASEIFPRVNGKTWLRKCPKFECSQVLSPFFFLSFHLGFLVFPLLLFGFPHFNKFLILFFFFSFSISPSLCFSFLTFSFLGCFSLLICIVLSICIWLLLFWCSILLKHNDLSEFDPLLINIMYLSFTV